MSKPIVIIGIGGLAEELAWLIDDMNGASPQWDLLGFVDPVESGKQQVYGYPVLGDYATAAARFGQPYFSCGMGDPVIRQKESRRAETLGWVPATLIHPSVVCAKFVSIGEGTMIAAGSVLGPSVRIGRHCVLNVQTFFGHGAHIGDFNAISPGARLTGNTLLGDHVFVGTNASVGPKCTLGNGARLAANSFLMSNLGAGESAIGVPAKVFHRADVAPV